MSGSWSWLIFLDLYLYIDTPDLRKQDGQHEDEALKGRMHVHIIPIKIFFVFDKNSQVHGNCIQNFKQHVSKEGIKDYRLLERDIRGINSDCNPLLVMPDKPQYEQFFCCD